MGEGGSPFLAFLVGLFTAAGTLALWLELLMREAAVRPDRAVVVVTHDNRVFGFGDRIAHMDDGAIARVDEGSREVA